MSQCHALIDPVAGRPCDRPALDTSGLCAQHQPLLLVPPPHEQPEDPTCTPQPDQGEFMGDNGDPHEPPHVPNDPEPWGDPTETRGDPTRPWDCPTKIENLDLAQRIAYVVCELPAGCICDSAVAQCHVALFGRPCRFPARRDRLYCINHDPETREAQLAHNRRASQRAAELKQRTPGVQDVALFLGTRAGIQAAIDFLVRAEFLGQVSPARSRNILRLLNAAIRNLGPQGRFRDDAMADYLNYREDIEVFMPDVLALARAWDAPPPKPEPAPRNAPPAPTEDLAGQFEDDDEEGSARYFRAEPSPPRPSRSARGRSTKTFGELLGSRANPDFVFSFDEDEIQTPADAHHLIARMRRR